MAPYNFLIAPDYLPKHFLDWYRLNTCLQKEIKQPMHLLMPRGQQMFKQMLDEAQPNLVYVNPFDADELINQRDYIPVVRPSNHYNEVIIFTRKDGPIKTFQDLKKGQRVVAMPNLDVEMMALRLLEAVDLTKSDLKWQILNYHQAVIRKVRDGEADFGLILSEIYHNLESSTKAHFNVLIESSLQVMAHILLVRDDSRTFYHMIQKTLVTAAINPNYQDLLQNLNLTDGFSPIDKEETQFMLDILETLKD